MNKTAIEQLILKASSHLSEKCSYAHAVLSGKQSWSGADLKGNARKNWRSYERQRLKASKALHNAGGLILPCEKGARLTAIIVCVDDYGNAIAATQRGFAWPNTKAQYKHK